MTIIEVLYLWSFLIVPVFIILFLWACEDLPSSFPCVLTFIVINVFLGFVGNVISDQFIDQKETCRVEMNPVSSVLTNGKLYVVTDGGDLEIFEKFEDVENWKNGGKLFEVYYFGKSSFGMDLNKKEIIIEKNTRETELNLEKQAF